MAQEQKFCVFAGGGSLPTVVIETLQAEKKPFHVITFKGQPQPDISLENIEHSMCYIARIGALFKILKKQNITHIVMAGYLSKPSIFDLKPDLRGAKLLASLAIIHDDAIFSTICAILEDEGFNIVAVQDVCPSLVAEKGIYGKVKPNEEECLDARFGLTVVNALGRLDIGQAAVVKKRVVLGLEAVEGTDKLLERCAAFRGKKNKGAVLIKAAKPSQDTRVDMPTIGVRTIELLKQYKYAGIAVQAGGTLIINKPAVVKAANKAGVFIIGISNS